MPRPLVARRFAPEDEDRDGVPHWGRVLFGLYHRDVRPLRRYLEHHHHIPDRYLRLFLFQLARSGFGRSGLQLAEGDKRISAATLRVVLSSGPIDRPRLDRLCKALSGMPDMPQLAVRKHPSIFQAKRRGAELMQHSADRRAIANYLASQGMTTGSRKRALGLAQERFGVGGSTLKVIWRDLGADAARRFDALEKLRKSTVDGF